MEKPQLVNFIANILEDSGFKVYKNFKTTQQIIDIYAILPTSMGDFALVVGCKNYDKEWSVGIDVLKEMEMVGKKLRASKVSVITSSKFSEQATLYAKERHIKLVDRTGLIRLAKKYQNKKKEEEKKAKENMGFYDYYSIGPDNSYENEEYSEDIEDLDYNDYDEYDDNRYRAQYLNSSYYSQLTQNNMNPQSSRISLNSRRNNKQIRTNPFNLGKSNNSQMKRPKLGYNQNTTNLRNNSNIGRTRREYKAPKKPIGERLKPLLRNPIIGIVLVVIISYLVSYLLKAISIPTGYIGLSELIVALILSYGLVFYSDRSNPNALIKATTIFFISLIILMILIVLT